MGQYYSLYLNNFDFVQNKSIISQPVDLGFVNELSLRSYSVSSDSNSSFFEITEPIISFPASSINTNNFFLYKEVYNKITKTTTSVPINIITYINDGVNLPPSILSNYNYIEYTPSELHNNYNQPSESNQIIYIKNLNFDLGATYRLKIKGLIGYLYEPDVPGESRLIDFSDEINIRFVAINSELNKKFIKAFTSEINNVVSKMYNITDLLDVDKIILDSDERYNFKYIPVDFNMVTQDYREYGNVDIEVDNSAIVEELFVKQYLNEFSNYFNDMSDANNRSLNSTLKSRYNVQVLKTIIAKHAFVFNQFKGNKKGISYIVNLFCDALGYDLLSIAENPYTNFSYTITSTLPKDFWENDIKPIVHPIPWVCQYNQIVFNYKDPVANWVNYHNIFHNTFELFYERKRLYSYLEKFNRYNNMNDNTYNDSNEIVSDLSDESEYRFSPSNYIYEYLDSDNINSIYHDSTLHLSNKEILKTTIDETNHTYKLKYEAGYALEYTWKIYYSTYLIDGDNIDNHTPILNIRSKNNVLYTGSNIRSTDSNNLYLQLILHNFDYDLSLPVIRMEDLTLHSS